MILCIALEAGEAGAAAAKETTKPSGPSSESSSESGAPHRAQRLSHRASLTWTQPLQNSIRRLSRDSLSPTARLGVPFTLRVTQKTKKKAYLRD